MEPLESGGIRAWRRRQLWTFAEAAFLIGGGREPPAYQIPDEMLHHIRTAGGEVTRMYEELKSSADLRKFEWIEARRPWLGERRAEPAVIVRWARALAFAVPADFADLAPPDDTDECDDLSLQTAAPAFGGTSANDHLAAMFAPVRAAELERLYPARGRWAAWCERKKRHGLDVAWVARGRFNPYLAGQWFLKQGEPGWSEARLFRALAKMPGLTDEQRETLTLAAGE